MRDDEMTDTALDEEIAQALAVVPPAELVARIRRRVATEHVSGVWAGSWLSWTAVAAGAVVAAAIAFIVARHGGATTESVPPLVARTIPYTSEGVAPGAPARRGAALPIGRAAPKADDTPEILVDPREARAFRSLIDGVRSGRLDLTGLLDATRPAVMDDGPIGDIYIEPIEWPPLIGGEQGVPR
jgi:hypothetical protein